MADAGPADKPTDAWAEMDALADPSGDAQARAEAELEAYDFGEDEGRGLTFGLNLSFRSRLTIGLIAASVLPLAGFGVVVLLVGSAAADATLGRVLLFAAVMAAFVGLVLSYLLAADLTGPLRAIASAVDRVSAGDLSTPIVLPGEDELALLARSHNRLAAVLVRRHRGLGRILSALQQTFPHDGAELLARRAPSALR